MGLCKYILRQCGACIKVWVISVGHGSVRTHTLAVLGLYKGMGHQCRYVGTHTLEVLGLYKGMGHQCGSWVCGNPYFGSAGPV